MLLCVSMTDVLQCNSRFLYHEDICIPE